MSIKMLSEICLGFQNGIGKNKEFYGRGAKVANIGDLYSNPIFSPTKYSFLEVTEKEKEKYLLKRGDILFVRSSLKREGVGVSSMYNSDESCLFSSFMIRCCPDPKVVDAKFLAYQLRSNNLRKDIINASNTSTITNISQPALKKVKVFLPPLPTQKRIAQILDQADALRRKDAELLAYYDKLVESVFLEMFGDVLKNTKKWKVVPFGKISTSILGRMLDKKRETGMYLKPYLKNTNVKWFNFNLEELPEMDFDEKAQKKYDLKFGDILICEGGEIGRAAIWKNEIEECYFQKALHRVRVNEKEVNQDFLVRLLYFYSQFGGFDKLATSATIAHLTGQKLKQLPIPLPPIDLQLKFASILKNIRQQQKIAKAAQVQSENLFQSLLQKAFKGEL
jgi:type I restriction enzyme S subunit